MGVAYVDWYGLKREQSWRTPPGLFNLLHERFKFTLDGAASEANRLLDKASTAASPLPWIGERVFCNPPWSDIASFIELAPLAEIAVLLVPARTNTVWFHRAISLGARIEFFLGRPKFLTPGGEQRHNSPVDCLLLVFDQ